MGRKRPIPPALHQHLTATLAVSRNKSAGGLITVADLFPDFCLCWLLSQMRMQLLLNHLPSYYLKTLLHKPPLSSNVEERESRRQTVPMQPAKGRKQQDTLCRSESHVFSTVQPFKRSQLSVLVTLQHYPLCQPAVMKDVLHNTSATNINISLQAEKKVQT